MQVTNNIDAPAATAAPLQPAATVFPSTYMGPVQLFSAMLKAGEAQVEQYDHYVKQTYRNRCTIAGPNGTQTLTIPVERAGEGKTVMRDLRISDHGNWRHLHWNALESSYGKSPFFEYYADDLRPFYTERRWTFLIDFNEELTAKILELLDVDIVLKRTSKYAGANLHQWAEPSALRTLPAKPYYQVFAQRHGFLPHLSIADLLFNMGPEAVLWLAPPSPATL